MTKPTNPPDLLGDLGAALDRYRTVPVPFAVRDIWARAVADAASAVLNAVHAAEMISAGVPVPQEYAERGLDIAVAVARAVGPSRLAEALAADDDQEDDDADLPPAQFVAAGKAVPTLSQALAAIAVASPGTQVIAGRWLRGELDDTFTGAEVLQQLSAVPDRLSDARDVVAAAVRDRQDRLASQDEQVAAVDPLPGRDALPLHQALASIGMSYPAVADVAGRWLYGDGSWLDADGVVEVLHLLPAWLTTQRDAVVDAVRARGGEQR